MKTGERYPDGRAAYCCDGCGLTGPWQDDWQWFGSFAQVDDGEAVPTFCGRCAAARQVQERKDGPPQGV